MFWKVNLKIEIEVLEIGIVLLTEKKLILSVSQNVMGNF